MAVDSPIQAVSLLFLTMLGNVSGAILLPRSFGLYAEQDKQDRL